MTIAALLIALAAVYFLAPFFDALLGLPVTAVQALHPLWWFACRPSRSSSGSCRVGTRPFCLLYAGHSGSQGSAALPAWRRVVQEILVIAQFVISIALIIGTGILFSQVELHTEQENGIRKGPGDRDSHGSAGGGQLPAVERRPVAVHRSGRREPGHHPARPVRYHWQDVDRYDPARRGPGPRPGIPSRDSRPPWTSWRRWAWNCSRAGLIAGHSETTRKLKTS